MQNCQSLTGDPANTIYSVGRKDKNEAKGSCETVFAGKIIGQVEQMGGGKRENGLP